MKKLCMIMAVILLFSFAFTSCGILKPTDADSIIKRIDKRMSRIYSYRLETDMNMTIYNDKTPISVTSCGETIVIYDSEGDNYYYDTSTTKVEDIELEQSDETTVTIAYNDGKMFSYSSDGTLDQRLCSEIEFEDFMEFISRNGLDTDDFFNGEKVVTDKKDDGGWVINYSEYSKEDIDSWLEELGLNELDSDLSVKDVNTTFECDKKYRVEKIKISFVFEETETDETPLIELSVNYYDYDEAKRTTDNIDPAEYQQVDDVRIIYEIEDMIDDKKQSQNEEFTLFIYQIMKYGNYTIDSYRETNDIAYGEMNGKYHYSISQTSKNGKSSAEYENGVTRSSDGETVECTDNEARAVVNSLIDSTCYSPSRVTQIEKLTDKAYKIKVALPTDYVDSISTQMEATCRYSACVINISLDDHGIARMKSDIDMTLLIDGKYVKYNIQITLAFDGSL